MPIYEFGCDKCGKKFEELVFGEKNPVCPNCGANDTHKLISLCARRGKGDNSGDFTAPSSTGGCGGCSGGNCGSCGR